MYNIGLMAGEGIENPNTNKKSKVDGNNLDKKEENEEYSGSISFDIKKGEYIDMIILLGNKGADKETKSLDSNKDLNLDIKNVITSLDSKEKIGKKILHMDLYCLDGTKIVLPYVFQENLINKSKINLIIFKRGDFTPNTIVIDKGIKQLLDIKFENTSKGGDDKDLGNLFLNVEVLWKG